MAAPIVIDLSSDDSSPQAVQISRSQKNASTEDFHYLSDDGGDIDVHADIAARRAPKRRRLSPSPSIDTGARLGDRDVATLDMGVQTYNLTSSPLLPSTRIESEPAQRSFRDILDPILLSSSPEPSVGRIRRNEDKNVSDLLRDTTDELSDILAEDLLGGQLTRAPPKFTPQISERTAALLADLDRNPKTTKRVQGESSKSPRSKLKEKKSRSVETGSQDQYASSTKGIRRKTQGSSTIDDSLHEDDRLIAERPRRLKEANSSQKQRTEERALERERAKQSKALEKEAEKERKRKLKEEKAREKQVNAELAQVNRAKIDKKTSTPEMIVDLPDTLEDGVVGEQIRRLLGNLQVKTTYYHSHTEKTIKWRRKVAARFNDELGHWEPVPEEIKDESHVLSLLYAKDFVDLVCGDPAQSDRQDLESHVLKLKTSFHDRKIICLIEGLAMWMRKNKNVRNRAYQAAVLSQMGSGEGGQGDTSSSATAQSRNSRRKKTPPEYVDEDMIEDGLLRLQVVHGCMIHHTAAPVETAEWISHFTQHISTIPYRAQRMKLDTSFCMDVGQVKTGDDKDDTYVKMLQEIVRVTPSIAYGIAGQYPDIQALLSGLSQRGPLALQDLKKTANKDGALTNSNIGPAISRRVYKIFLGTDPMSNDV
ncbi:MAG: hypothetical protein M1837_006280 [Sclerophora amabilis]|nr:MAG: hypothetical protein M1837_006280 [Sclerophora amabilis]